MEQFMIKRRLKIAVLILFLLVVGPGCLDSSATPTGDGIATISKATIEENTTLSSEETTQETTPVTPTEPEQIDSPQDLTMLEKSLWVQEGKTVFVSFFFENPNTDLIFEDVTYTVYLYDASGEEIDSDSSTMRWVFPEQTIGIVFNFYLPDEDITVDSVSVEWEMEDSHPPDDFTNPLAIEEATFWQNGNFPMVTGKITNNNVETYTNIRANIICYNAAEEIIGGAYTFVDFVPGSGFMGYATYVDVFDEVASVEVYPTFTENTVQYEGSDLWSEISILNDYFYEGNYGDLHGGAVIKNNTDTVLKDSVLYTTFYDESGRVTSTGNISIDILLPGDILGVTPWILSPPDSANTTEYDIVVLPGDVLEDYELTENPFTVDEASVIGEFDTDVSVKITNNYGKGVSEVEVYVLVYNADDQIIGGGRDWTDDPIPAGGSAEIDVWVNYARNQTIDKIRVWVAPNSWTEYE
jgi:uncharacterized protein YcfL